MKIKVRVRLREEMVNAKGKFYKAMQIVPSMDLIPEDADKEQIDKVMREALTKRAYKTRFYKKVDL